MIEVVKEEKDYLWCQSCGKGAKSRNLFETNVILEQGGMPNMPLHTFRLCRECYEQIGAKIKELDGE